MMVIPLCIRFLMFLNTQATALQEERELFQSEFKWGEVLSDFDHEQETSQSNRLEEFRAARMQRVVTVNQY